MSGYPQDVLTQVVNVRWGAGAVFVVGDDSGQIWYSDGTTDTSGDLLKVHMIGTPHEGSPPGQFNGSSYAQAGETTVFVMGGLIHAFDHLTDGHERGHYTVGKIVHSNDGRSWTEALSMGSSLTIPTTVLKIIWDNDRFYSLALRGLTDNLTSECWSSADGTDWALISSAPGGSNPAFESHCKYKDANDEGLADGEFGIDPAKKGSHETFPFGKVMDDGLLITRDDVEGSPVTFSGGTWGRANYRDAFGALEISKDSGNNWQTLGSTTPYDPELAQGAILTICAGRSVKGS